MGQASTDTGIAATGAVPAPPLAYRARLDELEGCWLHVTCGQCGRITTPPIKLLMATLGAQHQLGAIIPRLVCKTCKARPATVHLCETHTKDFRYGEKPGWSVQLYPLP